jgi:hypothetical protein
LKALLGTDEQRRIQFSDEFSGDGAALFKACVERGLEGIVSKHALAPYRSGRSKTWLKTKCFTESTFVVVGTDRDRKTGALRALLVHNDGSGLDYAGDSKPATARSVRNPKRLQNVLPAVGAFPKPFGPDHKAPGINPCPPELPPIGFSRCREHSCEWLVVILLSCWLT